ncbi:protein SERAC1 [Lycorma delicatula]|uniref:protein SERAC1 n=1 Tax=Lycorma delicatula TaxID=130591 RepID=UPI003F50F81D
MAARRFAVVYYQIHKTIDYFNNVINTKVLGTEQKAVSYIYLEDQEVKEILQLQFLDRDGLFKPNSFTSAAFIWWKNCRLTYTLQLLSVAMCSDCRSRLKAIEKLSNLQFLSSADFVHLSQKCDAKTAVGLARTPNADHRLFSRRIQSIPSSKQDLIAKMRDLLLVLNNKKEHECLTYFLSKTFPGFHDETGTFFDIEIQGKVRQPGFYNEDILPTCIKELAHYCSVEDNAKGDEHAMEFVKMMEQISIVPGSLNHLFITGWIKVLAEWSKHSDKRISNRAIHTLANLDSDDMFNAIYGPRIFLLHPAHRSFIANNCVDVIFVHGLLGGALVTWRQREVKLYQLSLYDLQSPQATSEPPQTKRSLKTSDADTAEYLKTVQDLKQEEWDKLGEDYEFVLCDFPTKMNSFRASLSIPGTNDLVKICLEEEKKCDFSSCWPQDWLAKDCPNIRVLCVNYNTRLSDWQFSCLKENRRDIETISDSLLEELVESGVGDRPTVWVVHSMGGLIVKSMLVKAWQRTAKKYQNFHRNSKGIVFLSTPHFGSHIATMFDSHRIILWPSNEVDDLRVNSFYLNKLHQSFLDWMKEVPQHVVTIAETKPTQLSGLGLWVEFLFVSPESADPGVGDVFFLPYDHVNICKPSNRWYKVHGRVSV